MPGVEEEMIRSWPVTVWPETLQAQWFGQMRDSKQIRQKGWSCHEIILIATQRPQKLLIAISLLF